MLVECVLLKQIVQLETVGTVQSRLYLRITISKTVIIIFITFFYVKLN